MKNTFLLIFFGLIGTFQLNAQDTTKHIVYFNSDAFSLTPAEQKSLQEFVSRESSKGAITSVKITGHTDSDAGASYNTALSQKRVNTVAAYFNQSTAKENIELNWKGEDQPLNTNASANEKKANRRVEIIVEHAVPEVSESTIKDLYQLLEQKKQVYRIYSKGDTTLQLDQGTIVYFPPYPFGKTTGSIIEIRAKECYKVSDMIMENLSTTSNAQLLESAGMIYLEAFSNNQPVDLVPEKAVVILMPTDTLRSDMKGFYGKRDPHTDVIDWSSSNSDYSLIAIPWNSDICDFDLKNDQIFDRCNRCRLFFCRTNRMDETFRGMVNQNQRFENKAFRKCQRMLRKERRNRRRNPFQQLSTLTIEQNQAYCAQLDSLFKRYNVNSREELLQALNKAKMEKYGVTTMEALKDTLQKLQLAEVEEKLMKGSLSKVNPYDLQFYITQITGLGWINTDAFSKLPGDRIAMETDLKRDKQTDCKVLFSGVNGLLPAENTGSHFQFQNVPKKNDIWMIGMRFKNNVAYLSITKTTSGKKVALEPFHEVTLDELKEELRKLDKR